MQKVLFIGIYWSGLRTLVDALLRKQLLTPPPVWIESVIKVASGDDGCCFTVNKDGIKEQINLAEYKRAPKYLGTSDPEYLLYESSAQADNLEFTIAYQYMPCENELLHYPCRQYDAVVYMLNATGIFTENDCGYIEEFLSDGSNRNLFFCINRMDCVEEEYVSKLKDLTKEKLKKVFTADGIFDEDLYQRRVFFISANNSLKARLGKPQHKRVKDVYVKDIDTGVPEFEYTLRKFLQQQAITKQRFLEQ